MKFLKVFFNSIISGFFFSGLLALLIIDLNINIPFKLTFLGQLSIFLTISYGSLILFLCVFIFFIIQFFVGRKINISLISPSFLLTSFTLLTGLFLLIYQENFKFFHAIFSPEIKGLLKAQFLVLLFFVLIGVIIFYCFLRFKKQRILFLILYFCFFGLTMIFSIYQRVRYPGIAPVEKTAFLEAKTINKKITIIGLEGLSFDFIIPLVNEDKLPNLSWLMENGAWGKLESFSPNEPLLLNASFDTGKFPAQHRQLSLFRYRILNSKQDIEVVPRFIFFRQLTRTPLLKTLPNPPHSAAKDIWQIFADNKTPFLKKDWPYDTKPGQISHKTETLFNLFFKDLKYETSTIFNITKRAFYSDAEFEDKVAQEKSQTQPRLVYFLLNGLNIVEANFYRYNFPDLFGNLDQELITKYGSVIERYYQFYDQIIGKSLAALKEDELLVVYSPHGIEPLPLWKRIVERILGNPNISAYHDNAPAGAVFFYGKDIVKGKNIEGMNLIDMVPTLLNYLGLPVGKDMDGIVYSSIFSENFKMDNPVLYISSYEETDIRHPE